MSKVKLTEISNITTGKLDSNAAEDNGRYPYFTCAPEPLAINTYAFDDDVILLAGNNASGNFHCQRYKGKFNAYQRTYVITAKDGYDIDYIYYNLKINLAHLKKIAQGSQTKFLTMQILDGFELEDIDLKEQRRLSKILSTIDKKIELNNKINTELEDMAKTLYDYWFLQFEFPNEEGKPYKSSGGKMVWNEDLKREIPEGWEVNSIAKSILKSKNGDWGTEEPTKKDDIKVNCFRGADFISITQEYNMTAPVRYIKKNNTDRLLANGDLITEISGGSPTQSTGRIGYINQGFLNRSANVMDCSNFCKAFTPLKIIYQFWLYQTWKSLYENGAMFNYESKTTGIKNLMFDDFINSIFFAYPKEEILTKFQNICEIYYDKIQKSLLENQELAALRDFLLPLLINGQVGFKK